jgi:long-chain acyl-CoA synthetase
MLPNTPEFIFTFFGIQKLGAVAVPFNTMYKGREISFILQDSGARAIVCLSSFANLINEIKPDCPDLELVITTGDRTLVYVDPDATVNVQMVFETSTFSGEDQAFREIEGLFIFNIVIYPQQMNTEPLFQVVYVPPEIRERAVELMTSVHEQTGTHPTL